MTLLPPSVPPLPALGPPVERAAQAGVEQGQFHARHRARASAVPPAVAPPVPGTVATVAPGELPAVGDAVLAKIADRLPVSTTVRPTSRLTSVTWRTRINRRTMAAVSQRPR